MDIIKIQTWHALLHQDNCVFDHKDEVDFFNLFTQVYKPYDFTNRDSYSQYLLKKADHDSWYVKGLFYFYCNGFKDPLFFKYKDFRYIIHPGISRMYAIGLRDKFDPLPCIIYSEKGEKLLPIFGLDVLNKIETIDFDANTWKNDPCLVNKDVKRYLPNLDMHFNQGENFWLEHTNDMYRIYFDDRQLLVFPKKGSLLYDKRIDLNIEDFNGIRNTILHLFRMLLNDK